MTPSFDATARDIASTALQCFDAVDFKDLIIQITQALRQAHAAGLEEGSDICANEYTTGIAMERCRARAAEVREGKE